MFPQAPHDEVVLLVVGPRGGPSRGLKTPPNHSNKKRAQGGAADPGLTTSEGSLQELAEEPLDESSFSSGTALASVSKSGGPAGQHVRQTSEYEPAGGMGSKTSS